MAKTTRLIDAVSGDPGIVPRTCISWDRRLPEEHRAEVEEIREAYRTGKLQGPRETLAKVISKHLRERGISNIGHDGVKRWLGES